MKVGITYLLLLIQRNMSVDIFGLMFVAWVKTVKLI